MVRRCHNPKTCKIHGSPRRRSRVVTEDNFKLFQIAGRALYGDLWCAPFAELIGTRPELLRAVALEHIPETIWAVVDAALAGKIGQLRLAKEIILQKRFEDVKVQNAAVRGRRSHAQTA